LDGVDTTHEPALKNPQSCEMRVHLEDSEREVEAHDGEAVQDP